MAKASPHLSIVVPSRANNFLLLEQFISCLKDQTFQDFELLLVCDRAFTAEERKDFQSQIASFAGPEQEKKIRLLSHQNTDFDLHHQGGASYVRNFGIKAANGNYLQLFDDDNAFDPDYLAKAISLHEKYSQLYGKEVFITPSLIWRTTDKVQNQGFSGYNYRLARPKIHFLAPGDEFAEIKMFSGNGIFGKAAIMKKVLYDEEIARIAEDLDFVYSIWELGTPILVFKSLKVRHQERDKTFLEEARIGTPKSAEQKIKNLFLWVKKHANYWQKLIFFFWSSWGICGRLAVKAFFHGGEAKWQIIKGLIRGYFKGWKAYRAS